MPLPLTPLIAAACLATGCAVALTLGPVAAAWERFNDWILSDVERDMKDLRIGRQGVRPALAAWGGLLVAVGLGIGVFMRSPVLALPLVVGGLFVPWLWLRHAVASRRRTLRLQLPPALGGLANAVRAGMPLAEGMRTVAAELPEPLRGEFRAIVTEHAGGRPLAAALEEVKGKLRLEPFTLFAATLQTTLQRGGRVSDMLETLGDSLRELDRLERTMDSATASHRKTIFILALFPALFLLGFLVIYPSGTMLMFTTTIGQGLLLVAAALVGLSVAWSQSILSLRQ
jgi:tight adherence protein B